MLIFLEIRALGVLMVEGNACINKGMQLNSSGFKAKRDDELLQHFFVE